MKTWQGKLTAIFVAMVLAGCASMNDKGNAAVEKDPDYLEAHRSLTGVPVSSADAWPVSNWWTNLHDEQLNQLMNEAFAESPTLKIAAARVRKAMAFADTSKSTLYPQLNTSLQVTRERFSENGLVPPPLGGTWATDHELQATLSWDADFWGKHRADYTEALGLARATTIEASATRLALSVNIAQTYIQLQRAFDQLDVAEQNLKDREHIYKLTKERNQAGIDSVLELKQTEANLPVARQQMIQLKETIQLYRNQLAALIGQGPDRGLSIARPALTNLGALKLPSTLPAELIGRRPDLAAQRARIEASTQGIKSAKADFYPNINLVTFVGLQSLTGAEFLKSASRTAGIGPAITLPIFNGGRLRANLEGKHADYDVAVEEYNQLLVNSIKDVVDQVASLQSIDAQRKEHAKTLSVTSEAYELARLRYKEGVGNYLQVLSAEAPLLTQKSLNADLQARQLMASVNLIKALGGGFDEKSISSD